MNIEQIKKDTELALEYARGAHAATSIDNPSRYALGKIYGKLENILQKLSEDAKSVEEEYKSPNIVLNNDNLFGAHEHAASYENVTDE